MPTARPRFQVTETPEIEHALRAAAQHWPELSRSDRVKRLILEGAETLTSEERTAARRREMAEEVAVASGLFTGLYEAEHRERLREEWPA